MRRSACKVSAPSWPARESASTLPHRSMTQNTKPPTRGGRFLKLAGMTASVAGDYTRGRIKRLFLSDDRAAEEHQANMVRAGTRIAETLGELKGAAMKIGQMASM